MLQKETTKVKNAQTQVEPSYMSDIDATDTGRAVIHE